MLTYRQALNRILDLPLTLRREMVPLLASSGRVLCDPVVAPWPLPRFDQSAMDGFALHSRETDPSEFLIVGESAAGHPFHGTVGPGEAVRISTGARIPAGAESVLPRELAQEGGQGKVRASELPVRGNFIRFQGEDVAEGEALFEPGTRIDAPQLAFLSMFNLAELPVYAPPRIAILGSGDEVRPLGAPLRETDIVGSSLYYLSAELAAFGCEPRIMGISPDEPGAFRDLLEEALRWGDAVISTAGVSVGDHDVVGQALQAVDANVLFWRVAVRPGKPMMVAMARDKPVFGLPGNPVSTFCNTEIFIKPFLRQRMGIEPAEIGAQSLPLAEDCPRDGHRLFFVMAQCIPDGDSWRVRPLGHQSSGNLFNAARANAMIVLEAGPRPALRGEPVPVLPLIPGR